MRFTNYFLSYLLILIAPLDVAAKGLSLKDLIDYAVKNSPTYKNSLNSLTINEMQKENAFANFLPSLDIQTLQGYRNGEPLAPANELSSQLQLSLATRLYDNGSKFINYDSTHLRYLQSQVELERDLAQLCLEISREYYNYLISSQLLSIQNSQYKLLQKQFLSVKSLYRQGRQKRIDFVRFKARVQRANLSKKQAEITRKRSLVELKRILAWKDDLLVIESSSKVSLNINKIPSIVPDIENHYETKIANYEREINDFTIDLEKRKYWPEVSLDTGVTYNNSEYLRGIDSFEENRQTDWSAVLSVRFNLWDWGVRRRNVAISRLQTSTANNIVTNRLLSLRTQIDVLILNIVQEKENYQLNKELMSLERKNFTAIKKSYRNGKTTFLDLINSLDNYTAAQQSYFTNFYQLKNSLAEYYFHEGTLYEKIQTN